MKINEFRFLNPQENFLDRSFYNWSRCYEWGYVLHVLKNYNNIKIHNTCCGPSEIHKQFHDALCDTGNTIINSDNRITDMNSKFQNFKVYDLTTKDTEKYDMVLCISTLEELPKNEAENVFNNLLDQVKPGGRLIITCDYPDVSVETLEKILSHKCERAETILNGTNSIYAEFTYSHLSVILIDIEK